MLLIAFSTNYSYYYQYILIVHDVSKDTYVKHIRLYPYLFILHSVYGVSCWPHADQILPKLPATHTRLSRPKLECTPNVMAASILFTNSDTDLQSFYWELTVALDDATIARVIVFLHHLITSITLSSSPSYLNFLSYTDLQIYLRYAHFGIVLCIS